ncbi:MAG: flippase-like domain-containing protein [bacterium]|nr:flippase-like domain-containing protein [bacterium]
MQEQLKQQRAEPRKPNRKKVLFRCLISVVLLSYLLFQADLSTILDAFKNANPFWLLFSFLLHIVGFLLTAYRWQLLLAARDAHFSISSLVQTYIIGVFFNNFLPSTVGGDVFRAYDTADRVGSKTEAMTVVVVERLTGMFALGLFALLALVLGFSHFGSIPIIWSAIGGLGVAFVLFLAAINHRVAQMVKNLFEHPEMIKFPFLRKVQAKLKQIYEALCIYKRNTRVMAVAFVLALLLQINVILHYYFISYAMGLPVPALYFFLIIPVVTVVLMIPIFINGIGGREAAYILLLGEFGVSSAEAIAFSWIAFGMVLVQGIVGGAVYALRKN